MHTVHNLECVMHNNVDNSREYASIFVAVCLTLRKNSDRTLQKRDVHQRSNVFIAESFS